MDGFNHLLNWKLLQGSHRFPGKDGGTCINEAALVAAGFEYKPITCAEDMPDCFSRPICRFALKLNDEADDVDRQRLLPFVARLACADTPDVERMRANYISSRSHRMMSFDQALDVLEGALAIGRRADSLAPEEVQGRMDAARANAPLSAVPRLKATGKPVMAKLKTWLGLEPEPT
jgi:hypothetical protein